jgi:tyrosyl-tRNA synthetase
MGGNDQWGNILAGADLTRRLEGQVIHALTFPLLTTSSGIKMGKTHEGAIWLDATLTSPYDYYQYWINQDDRDVEQFMGLFTFLAIDEVRRLSRLKGADIRKAKETLAYETTKLCHGQQAAQMAREASQELFGSEKAVHSEATPCYRISREELDRGIPAYILFEKTGLCRTRAEARRLIAQGGGYLNGQRIQTFDQLVNSEGLENGSLLLRAGKKRYLRITNE